MHTYAYAHGRIAPLPPHTYIHTHTHTHTHNKYIDTINCLTSSIVAVIGRIIFFSSQSDPLLNSMNVLSCFDINSRIFSSVVNNIVYINQYFCALRIKFILKFIIILDKKSRPRISVLLLI